LEDAVCLGFPEWWSVFRDNGGRDRSRTHASTSSSRPSARSASPRIEEARAHGLARWRALRVAGDNEQAAEAKSVLWPEVISELEAKGIRAGPESFQNWNDGDAGLVRAIWCLTRHLSPKKVVETGVAHGVTSRCILEAFTRSGDGHLWSIDLPPLVGASRSARQSATASQIDGHMLGVRAGGGFPSYFLALDRLIFSFTTASTVSATCVSSSTEPGQP
jgi:hypothetical protein